MPPFHGLTVCAWLLFGVTTACGPRSAEGGQRRDIAASQVADSIRLIERVRLKALVDGDTITAGPLHADDFQLITPNGAVLSRERYLSLVASGMIDYISWVPESIAVRIYPSSAMIRYRSRMLVTASGDTVGTIRHWHTDLYELRSNRWQAVWSQASPITP